MTVRTWTDPRRTALAGRLGLALLLAALARTSPALQATLPAGPLRPGSVAVCKVEGLAPVGMTLAGFSQEAGFYFSKASGAWVALMAVPLEARPGRRRVELRWPGGSEDRWVEVRSDPSPGVRAISVRGLDRRLEASEGAGDGGLLKRRQKGRAPLPLWRGTFAWPLSGAITVTSPFGLRRVYNRGRAEWRHRGVDLRAPRGTPVLAANDGVVVLVRRRMALTGGTVVIDHGYGLTSSYFHLGALAVREGQAVAKGQVLGSSGASGLAAGPHLHFELRLHGRAVSPLQWLQHPAGGGDARLAADWARAPAPGPI